MRTMYGGPCLHYDCTNRNSFGYCRTTVCINSNYSREWIESTAAKSETIVAKPVTNADRIRAMTDKQLAGWFDKLTNGCDLCPIRRDCEIGVESFGRCDDKWLAWLKSPEKGTEE